MHGRMTGGLDIGMNLVAHRYMMHCEKKWGQALKYGKVEDNLHYSHNVTTDQDGLLWAETLRDHAPER
jgi:hypothetical protein